MTIEPTTEEPLAGLLPGHVIIHPTYDDSRRRLVVDEVTRKLGGWSVAARPAHRSEGRRVVVEFDEEKATVTRLASPEEWDAVAATILGTVRQAADDHAKSRTGGDHPPNPVDVASVGEAIDVRLAGRTWRVEL